MAGGARRARGPLFTCMLVSATASNSFRASLRLAMQQQELLRTPSIRCSESWSSYLSSSADSSACGPRCGTCTRCASTTRPRAPQTDTHVAHERVVHARARAHLTRARAHTRTRAGPLRRCGAADRGHRRGESAGPRAGAPRTASGAGCHGDKRKGRLLPRTSDFSSELLPSFEYTASMCLFAIRWPPAKSHVTCFFLQMRPHVIDVSYYTLLHNLSPTLSRTLSRCVRQLWHGCTAKSVAHGHPASLHVSGTLSLQHAVL